MAAVKPSSFAARSEEQVHAGKLISWTLSRLRMGMVPRHPRGQLRAQPHHVADRLGHRHHRGLRAAQRLRERQAEVLPAVLRPVRHHVHAGGGIVLAQRLAPLGGRQQRGAEIIHVDERVVLGAKAALEHHAQPRHGEHGRQELLVARPVHDGRADDHGRDLVGELAHRLLTGQLAAAVERDRGRGLLLAPGTARNRGPRGRQRRAVHEPRRSGQLRHGLHQPAGALGVALEVALGARALVTPARWMHAVHVLHGLGEPLAGEQIAHREARPELLQPAALGGAAHQRGDRVAPLDERRASRWPTKPVLPVRRKRKVTLQAQSARS